MRVLYLEKIMKMSSLIHLLFISILSMYVSTIIVTAIDINEIQIEDPLLPQNYFGGADHESYLSWYNDNESSYTGSIYIPADGTTATSSNNGAAVHWRVDAVQELLYLAVAARAEDGWVAFGMAEAGGMKGSDIVIFESSKPDTLTDAHVLSELVPLIDICQDWDLISATNEGGFIIFEGIRKFDTGDAQDHVVIDDTETFIPPQKVIVAWGNDTDTLQYHGKTNRGRSALRWFGVTDDLAAFRQRMAIEATGYFDLSVGNYSIKAVETEYVNFCFDWVSDIEPQGVPADIVMISSEVILDQQSGPFVHHTTLVATQKSENETQICDYTFKENDQFLYAWSFGLPPVEFPSDVGYTLGATSGLEKFVVALHYNNPKLITGVTDNSKFRIYYSTTPRAYELGILAMADIFVSLRGQPVSPGVSKYTFGCSDQCSLLVLDEPVTVINEVFHMHTFGSAAVQYQIRNGEVIHQANVNFFDFDQSGIHAVRQRPFQLLPGDAFTSSCMYETANGTSFGRSSVEEMCEAFIFYYPAKTIFDRGQWSCGLGVPISACNATTDISQFTSTDANDLATTDSLQTFDFFERTFGVSTSDQCEVKPLESKNYSLYNMTTSGHTDVSSLIFWVSCATLVWTAVHFP